jgi:lipopolysaccharide transport system ATP-binding protein
MKRAEIDRRFDEIVAFSEVEKFLDTPVKRYSSGMYVRLAFSVAAHLEPEILVIDEVLAVGDARFQKKCLSKMEEVGQSGRTVIFVSHNMSLVRSLCSRAVLLDAGRVVMDAPVDDVAAKYLSEGAMQPVARSSWRGENAPHNRSARMSSVALRCDDGDASDLTIDAPFHVDLEFEVMQPESVVGITLVLHDVEGTCIFSSIGNREPRWYGKPMPAGRYRSRCTVPANLLNAGTFSLSVIMFGEGFSDPITVRDVLLFRLRDSEALRRGFSGVWSGAVRPALDWITTESDEQGT